jgi:PKD repeat protein
MGRNQARLPDYSIGATVLVVAITLPFFVFARAEHLQRAGAKHSTVTTPRARVQAVITTPAPIALTPSPMTPTPSPSSPPLARATASAKRAIVHPTNPPTVPSTPSPTSSPSPIVSPTASPTPDAPPVAQLALSATAGPAPLTVTADASGSTDTDQTPIAEVIFDFGDGTIVTVQSGRTATHTYTSAGTYTLAVAVIDTARLSSTVSTTVTVS